MWVVKLGGSLLGQPELKSWLDMLAGCSDGRIIIVPGGGLFADAVRQGQKVAGYDDAAAHHMALLAMEQTALAMQALQPELVTASSELEIAERSWQHRAILWLPTRMALADETIAMSWDVTSDSLAAWLAARVKASRLVLVKQQRVAERPLPFGKLMADGVVDMAFGKFSGRLGCPIEVMGKSDIAVFTRAFAAKPTTNRADQEV